MYYFFLNDNWSCSRKLIDLAYTPFHAVLKCGHLTSDVQVFPRPEPFIIDEEIDPIPKAINTGNIFYCFLHQSVWFLPFHFHLFSCIVTVAPAFSLKINHWSCNFLVYAASGDENLILFQMCTCWKGWSRAEALLKLSKPISRDRDCGRQPQTTFHKYLHKINRGLK